MALIKADGFDKAILGVAQRSGQPDIIAYDTDKCIEIIMKDHDCDVWDAVDYFNFNVVGSYIGEYTPIFITRTKNMQEIQDWAETNE